MQSMQEELTRAKESAANTATAGQHSHVVTEPVGMKKKKATLEPVRGEALQTGPESAKIITTLREELEAQETLREKEREQRKLAEDEGGGWKKGLWKSHTMTG